MSISVSWSWLVSYRITLSGGVERRLKRNTFRTLWWLTPVHFHKQLYFAFTSEKLHKKRVRRKFTNEMFR